MKDYGYLALVALSVLADLISVMAFLGVQPTQTWRLLIGIGLLLLALFTAVIGLITSVRLWLSPQGSHYPASTHVKRIGAAITAAILAICLSIFVYSHVGKIRDQAFAGMVMRSVW